MQDRSPKEDFMIVEGGLKAESLGVHVVPCR